MLYILKKEFGEDIIITNNRTYVDDTNFSNETQICDVSFNRENDGYLRGIEYLSSMMILSKCGGLVAGICGGSLASYFINNGKYKDIYIFLI